MGELTFDFDVRLERLPLLLLRRLLREPALMLERDPPPKFCREFEPRSDMAALKRDEETREEKKKRKRRDPLAAVETRNEEWSTRQCGACHKRQPAVGKAQAQRHKQSERGKENGCCQGKSKDFYTYNSC
jgi:hypothetical protein